MFSLVRHLVTFKPQSAESNGGELTVNHWALNFITTGASVIEYKNNPLRGCFFVLVPSTVKIYIIHDALLCGRVIHDFFFIEPNSDFTFCLFW
jgi:hypothetical protein